MFANPNVREPARQPAFHQKSQTVINRENKWARCERPRCPSAARLVFTYVDRINEISHGVAMVLLSFHHTPVVNVLA